MKESVSSENAVRLLNKSVSKQGKQKFSEKYLIRKTKIPKLKIKFTLPLFYSVDYSLGLIY